jgi:hypothetical protein
MAGAERDVLCRHSKALLCERSNAYQLEVAGALHIGCEPPDVTDLKLSDVLGLGRQLGWVQLRRCGSALVTPLLLQYCFRRHLT